MIADATMVTPARVAGDVTPTSPTDRWLQLRSSATGQVERIEANWQARILIGAFWHELRAADDDTLKGGGLSFDSSGIGGGMTILIASDAADYLFTDQDGKPSPLVANKAMLRAHIMAEAAKMGLVIRSATFFSVLGTDVKVLADAPNPTTYVQQYPDNYGDLFGDPGAIEGVMLVVTDPLGDLVQVASYSTGTLSGQGGLGQKYARPLPTDSVGNVGPFE